ncbi:MAG TPA: DUF3570 domain-containing protein [Solimonas sp.]|nr:DUF3570 domain-containing protein [Solimonas sp.]
MAATKTSAALAALSQAALTLPAFAAPEVQTDYLYSNYHEQDIPAGQSARGRDETRYDIQSHLFRVIAPFDEQSLGLNLTYESMSGASPWFVTPATDGRPVQVMSGPSIEEKRIDAQATWSMPLGVTLTGFTLGYSTEDDYRALNGGLEVQLDNEDRTLTWTGGLGYSADQLRPTVGPSSPNVIREADKDTLTAYGGAALVLDPATVVQASVGYARNDGYLSDPYKLAWIESQSNTVPDRRPDGRQAWTVSAKLRHHLAAPNAALHLDYRYYHDDWDVDAHTMDLAWHQVLAGSWRVTPALRWYSQSRAFFYAPYYGSMPADGYVSSDYRLSPYGAVSARLDVVKSLQRWALGAGAEYYVADADYALKSVNLESPGLVEYLSLQLRLSYRF